MATTTIKWNTTGNTYVHAQLGDDLNGTGEANRPFQSLYRAAVKGGSIVAMGIFSENLELWKFLSITADSFGAAIFDGKRLTGMGGAVHNHSKQAGDDSQGYEISGEYIYNFIYLRSRVPVGYAGVGYYVSGGLNYVGGGSLLVDSASCMSICNGDNCAWIYPKLNNNTYSDYRDMKYFRMNCYNASYSYGARQTIVGVKNYAAWSRPSASSTKSYCVYDECEMPVIFNNGYVVTFDHCAFRNVTFVIPASLSNDNTEHRLTTDDVTTAVANGISASPSQYITDWINQHKTTNTSYKANVFNTCVTLHDTDPLFNNLHCVWRDATTEEIVDADESENAYIDPELSSFDISIDANSPAVPYLSAYGANWRGAPSLNFKMAAADNLDVDENASGDIQLTGNLKFEQDEETGKNSIVWDKAFNDPTIVTEFKGGAIITRPRKVPSDQLFKFPKISGMWGGAFLGENSRGTALLGRSIVIDDSHVTFDGGEALDIEAGRLWLKDSPASNEITAGYHYIVKSGTVCLYNSSNMSYIEFNTGAIIDTIAGNTYFIKRLYDGGAHPIETPELIEVIPNSGATEYDYASRIEIRLFNSAAKASEYNTNPLLKEQMWIPISAITDTVQGLHYYDLPQNDIVFDPSHGYLITQNPHINDTTNTLAVHSQHSDERYDAYKGDNIGSLTAGVYTKTTNKNRARYPFSPLSTTDIYVQLRFKIIPFMYP